MQAHLGNLTVFFFFQRFNWFFHLHGMTDIYKYETLEFLRILISYC